MFEPFVHLNRRGRYERSPQTREKLCDAARRSWQEAREWAAKYYQWPEVQEKENPCFIEPTHQELAHNHNL